MNKITKLPTPLEFLMSNKTNNIYIKRDDLTDLALGGNKVRKINYFLKDAKNKGADCIVTYGASQSNHCRVTAAAASRLGLKTVLIMPYDDNVDFNGNYFLYSFFNVHKVWTDLTSVSKTIDETIKVLKEKGFTPYFIQGGGHGNLGTHAYVEAYREIAKQSTKAFDYIFLPSGTGTTQAGLIIGSKEENKKTNIIGISVARNKDRGKEVICQSINDYLDEYPLEVKVSAHDVIFIDDYVGKGYGDIYPEVLRTIKKVANKTAILLDPVYTGKAFYGMTDYLNKNKVKNKRILFIHTGGIPLLFNNAKAFEEM